tara:strand:- start:55 stop:222 length:168 start_codon:yes stop_codon:yes gene_type:complete
MDDFVKINSLSAENRELLTDLTSTFDLGTRTINERDKKETINDLSDLMSEVMKVE